MLLYFVAQIVQLWPLGALVLIIVQSCDLWHTLINERFVLRFWGNTSLLSDTTKYYSLILYISCPSPRIRYSPNKQRICIFKSIWSIIVNMPSRNHSVLIYNHYSNRYENVHLPHTLANVGQCLWDEMVCVSSLCNTFHVTIWFPVELQEGNARWAVSSPFSLPICGSSPTSPSPTSPPFHYSWISHNWWPPVVRAERNSSQSLH